MDVTDIVIPDTYDKNLAEPLTQRRPNAKYLIMSGYTANVTPEHSVLESGVHFPNYPFSKRNQLKKVWMDSIIQKK